MCAAVGEAFLVTLRGVELVLCSSAGGVVEPGTVSGHADDRLGADELGSRVELIDSSGKEGVWVICFESLGVEGGDMSCL